MFRWTNLDSKNKPQTKTQWKGHICCTHVRPSRRKDRHSFNHSAILAVSKPLLLVGHAKKDVSWRRQAATWHEESCVLKKKLLAFFRLFTEL